MLKSAFLLGIIAVCLQIGLSTGAILDKETFLNFTEIVQSRNYPYELHSITTKDGYILTAFRIQAQHSRIVQGKQPVILQHSITDSSDAFILNKERSLAFILANKGYDIWLLNSRGNKYSQSHIKYSIKDDKFWDFSWEDQARDDLPAAFIYINKLTNKKIDYIGYSLGSTIMFAALAERNQDILKNLNHYIALAPLTYMQYTNSPALKLLKYLFPIPLLSKIKNLGILPYSQPSGKFSLPQICANYKNICKFLLKFIEVDNPEVERLDRAAIYVGHIPAGASLKGVNHMIQQIKQTLQPHMTKYDYGKIQNKAKYGQITPPEYPLNQIKEKVYLFAGAYDRLVPTQGAILLKNILPNAEYYQYNYGHLSFLIGQDNSYIQKILDILAKDN